MNVCGVLVHADPRLIDAVESDIGAIPGVECHGRAAHGRLMVTVEDTGTMTAADALSRLHALPGVIAAALVYHQFEPDETGEQDERTLSC